MKFLIRVSGYIGPDSFSFFSDGGDTFSLSKLNAMLDSMPAGTTEIDVEINSGGGLVTEGFAIHDKLMTLQQIVNTKVTGQCGSIATVIAQAGRNKGKRYMFQNSEYFIHNPIWIPSGPDPMQADELQKLADEMKDAENQIVDFYVSTTGQTREALSEKMKVQTTMKAEEALSLGFVDEVIQTNAPATAENLRRYQVLAATQTSMKAGAHSHVTTQINDMNKKIENLFAAMQAQIKAAVDSLKKPAQNTMVTTSENKNLYFAEDALAVGILVFENEAMTSPAPDAEYTVDAQVVAIVGGKVESLEPSPEPVDSKAALDAAKAENVMLKQQLDAAKAEAKAANDEKSAIQNSMTALNASFDTFKTEVLSGIENLDTETPEDKAARLERERIEAKKDPKFDKFAGKIKKRAGSN